MFLQHQRWHKRRCSIRVLILTPGYCRISYFLHSISIIVEPKILCLPGYWFCSWFLFPLSYFFVLLLYSTGWSSFLETLYSYDTMWSSCLKFILGLLTLILLVNRDYQEYHTWQSLQTKHISFFIIFLIVVVLSFHSHDVRGLSITIT